LMTWLADWLAVPWFAWGVLPIICANLGYWLPMLVLEAVLKTEWAAHRLVQRPKGGRAKLAEADRATVASYGEQVMTSVGVLLGPGALLNGLISRYLMAAIVGVPKDALPSPGQLLVHLVLLELIGDFGLYWGHRIQHEIPFLWKNFHWKHHQIGTPTPASTIFIDTTDAVSARPSSPGLSCRVQEVGVVHTTPAPGGGCPEPSLLLNARCFPAPLPPHRRFRLACPSCSLPRVCGRTRSRTTSTFSCASPRTCSTIPALTLASSMCSR
jgi:hypothetical protein